MRKFRLIFADDKSPVYFRRFSFCVLKKQAVCVKSPNADSTACLLSIPVVCPVAEARATVR